MVKQSKAGQYLGREVKLDMSGPALHGGQDVWGGGSGDGMDLLYLVHLVGARKQGEQAHHLHNRTGLFTQKTRKVKTTPFGVDLMRSQELYQAAQALRQRVAMVQHIMISCECVWGSPSAVCLCLHAPICLSVRLSVCQSVHLSALC